MEGRVKMTPKIKICGITNLKDIEIVNKYNVDFAGFVLFFPKSKRNLKLQQARELKQYLNRAIKTVAVTVCPSREQIEQIQQAGFDYIQVHGEWNDETMKHCRLPIFRAFHISKDNMVCKEVQEDNIVGYVLDGEKPGNGQVFDWELMKYFNRGGKLLMLAGGLCAKNVVQGIEQLHPNIVDVSSGVEKESGSGKSKEKVEEFVNAVRSVG